MIISENDLGLSVISSHREREAIAESIILPGQTGRIRFRGTTWKARCININIKIAANDIVEVIGRNGLTLLIEPLR
jgi:membrane protein implicated in regulation of membrane protease activity